MSEIIVLVAMNEELPKLKDEPNVYNIGVGKVNAAFNTTRILSRYVLVNGIKPKLVINYGTAGSIKEGLSGLVECTGFVQRDMDCSSLGFEKYQTPFDDVSDSTLIGAPGMVCGTGDSFVCDKKDLVDHMDLVDMESYAVAKVCKDLGTKFRCFKYISDEADSSAVDDWKSKVSSGEEYFIEKLSRVIEEYNDTENNTPVVGRA